MNSINPQAIPMNCSSCGAELRPNSLYCPECGASSEGTSSWPDKPWLTIWTNPRFTIRSIIDNEPEKHVIVLAILAGIVNVFDNASERGIGDDLPFGAVLILILVLGAIGGPFSLYLGGAVFRWTGSWFGGQASSKEVRAAIAWSWIPIILQIPLLVLLLLVYGNELFSRFTPNINESPLVLMCSVIPSLVLSLWFIVLLVVTVSEVHRFSVWKSLAALAIPLLAIAVPALACGFLLAAS